MGDTYLVVVSGNGKYAARNGRSNDPKRSKKIEFDHAKGDYITNLQLREHMGHVLLTGLSFRHGLSIDSVDSVYLAKRMSTTSALWIRCEDRETPAGTCAAGLSSPGTPTASRPATASRARSARFSLPQTTPK